MDQQRLDDLTQRIALLVSRRSVVRALAGVALGGLLRAHAAGAAAPATPAAPRTQKRLAKLSVLKAGLKWIESQQDARGAILGSDGIPDVGTTAAVVSALIALRNIGIDVDLDPAVAYLEQSLPRTLDESTPYDEVAQTVLALAGAGSHKVGDDLLAYLAAAWTTGTTISGSDGVLRLIAYGMMAVAAAGQPIEEQAIKVMVGRQLDDGSWDAYGTTDPEAGDAITTALIIQTLVAAGHGGDAMVAAAVAYLRTVQVDGGAFALAPGEPPDAYSTGAVISALIAVGENPKAQKWGKAVSGLLAFQNESGAFRYTDEVPTDDATITVWALTALAGAHWPVLPATA